MEITVKGQLPLCFAMFFLRNDHFGNSDGEDKEF